eukprot:429817_1
MTIILDGALKVGTFVAVVVVILGITYFVSVNNISTQLPGDIGRALVPVDSTKNGLKVAIDVDNAAVHIVGTNNCSVNGACETGLKCSGIGMGVVANLVLASGTVLQHICDNKDGFSDMKMDVDVDIDVDNKVLKEGFVYMQYGLEGGIQNRKIVISEEYFSIVDNEIIHIKWNKLLNIDDFKDNKNCYSFQVFFKHELYSNIYIYVNSKAEKIKWIKLLKKMSQSVILTKELQTLKSHAVKLGFTASQIEKALTEYHIQFGTVYNIHVFIGGITGGMQD